MTEDPRWVDPFDMTDTGEWVPSSEHPRNPYLAADVIVSCPEGVVFIERKNPPHGLAFPGGFVDYGESVEDAACREMKEELNISIEPDDLALLNVYSKPGRDPRQHVVSVVFFTQTNQMPIAGDDAAKVRIYSGYSGIPKDELVFDHAEILNDFVVFMRELDNG